MKKFSKIAAFIFALSLSATVMTACGDSKDSKKSEPKSVEDIDEKDMEDALNKLDEETSKELAKEKEEATEPTTAAEIVYEPTEEIKKADFHSPIIQIGNDLFKRGGYYTLKDFVEEFGDRYDMSEINLEGRWGKDNHSAFIVSKNDPDLKISISFYSPTFDGSDYDKAVCPVADTIVVSINTPLNENTWYPTGITTSDNDMKFNDMEPYFEKLGLPKVESDLGVYDAYLYKPASDFWQTGESFEFSVRGNEENLYGCYPVYNYHFDIDAKTSAAMFCVGGINYNIDDTWKSGAEKNAE